MSTSRTPQQLILEAQQTHQAAKEANERLAAALTAAIRSKLQVGQVINLNERQCGINDHLVFVKTISGKDHGTRIFRIESAPTVEVHPSFVELAKWKCQATPISEKTGKDMSGASHGAGSRQTVAIQGDLFVVPDVANQSPAEAAKADMDMLIAFMSGGV